MRRAAALLLALPLAAAAQTGRFDEDFDADRPWKEIEAQLPALPKAENLLRFNPGPALTYTYAVDAVSIAVGGDGVVRYSLLVESPEGARTVSFEGIRCATREHRLYAFGRPDNSWSRARDARWQRIELVRHRMHQMVLYSDFFCPGFRIVDNAQEAVQALKRGGHPRATSGSGGS